MRVGLFYFAPKVEQEFNTNYFPNNLGYIASYLDRYNGAEVFIDYKLSNLIKRNPDIIGIASYTETYNQAIKITAQVKEILNIPVIVGGHHISNLPDNLHPAMTAGVIGEGEEVMSEIVKVYQKDRELVPENLCKIRGIVYHSRNGTELTSPAEAVNPIDKIPSPLRRLAADMDGHIEHYILSARGCPFKCIYCAAGLAMESVRYHSSERVITEITELLRDFPGQQFISIKDDLFAMNKKRLKELCDLIRAEGIHKKVQFSCNARASCFDKETAQILSDMNVKILGFGLESGNDRVLKYLKGSSSVARNQRALDLCAQYNIAPYTHFIVGSPTETLAETAGTYWFVRRNSSKLWRANLRVATPLPGTDLWHLAHKEKLIPEKFSDWETMDLWFTPERSVYVNQEYSAEVMHKEVIPHLEELITGKPPMKNSEVLYRTFTDLFGSKFKKVLEITDAEDKFSDYFSFDTFQKLKTKNGYLEVSEVTEKFDLILLTESLGHLRYPEAELKKIKSLLTPDGKLGIVFLNSKFSEFILNLLRYFQPEYHNKIMNNPLLKFLNFNNVTGYLQKGNYKILDIFPVTHESPRSVEIFKTEIKKLLNGFQQKELEYTMYYLLAEIAI